MSDSKKYLVLFIVANIFLLVSLTCMVVYNTSPEEQLNSSSEILSEEPLSSVDIFECSEQFDDQPQSITISSINTDDREKVSETTSKISDITTPNSPEPVSVETLVIPEGNTSTQNITSITPEVTVSTPIAENTSEIASVETPTPISEKPQSMRIMSEAKVTDSGTYTEHFSDIESVNVFAEDVTNCFTILLGASYNIWGNGTQDVVFNTQKISEYGNSLTFTVGMTANCEDYIECCIFLDTEEIPTLKFNISADSAPETYTIDNLSNYNSMKIVLNNYSSNMNSACFYNFVIE